MEASCLFCLNGPVVLFPNFLLLCSGALSHKAVVALPNDEELEVERLVSYLFSRLMELVGLQSLSLLFEAEVEEANLFCRC